MGCQVEQAVGIHAYDLEVALHTLVAYAYFVNSLKRRTDQRERRADFVSDFGKELYLVFIQVFLLADAHFVGHLDHLALLAVAVVAPARKEQTAENRGIDEICPPGFIPRRQYRQLICVHRLVRAVFGAKLKVVVARQKTHEREISRIGDVYPLLVGGKKAVAVNHSLVVGIIRECNVEADGCGRMRHLDGACEQQILLQRGVVAGGHLLVADTHAGQIKRREAVGIHIFQGVKTHHSAKAAEIEVAIFVGYSAVVAESTRHSAPVRRECLDFLRGGIHFHKPAVCTEPQVAELILKHVVDHIVGQSLL